MDNWVRTRRNQKENRILVKALKRNTVNHYSNYLNMKRRGSFLSLVICFKNSFGKDKIFGVLFLYFITAHYRMDGITQTFDKNRVVRPDESLFGGNSMGFFKDFPLKSLRCLYAPQH